ncbi:sulfotransferase domain-containing protein [Aquirufa ecclesiirivi]|uniref:sulfotransferase domain-containing protein n=1 Tax=Aquirufa ecclesiirivi TaxID=2715124 RepID=UPI0022A9DADC|nr:sulfotransferase domain-containing protein [Aquirufa ecclesiirivi]
MRNKLLTKLEIRKNIIWLASYPKSGNTWFRGFITALKNGGKVHINELGTAGIFSNKFTMEDILDVDADDISRSDVDHYKRLALTHQSSISEDKIFIKIHDLYSLSKYDNKPIVPFESTYAAIYFVRNPLDVAISLANHNGQTIDYVIEKVMGDPLASISRNIKYLQNQFPQWIGTWENHVTSWKQIETFPVYFVRYEDMKQSPQKTFSDILQKIGYIASELEISRALEAAKFENLKQQEQECGFKEKPLSSKMFFHKGEMGQWREQLTKSQVDKIKQLNEPMMREFGYWED